MSKVIAALTIQATPAPPAALRSAPEKDRHRLADAILSDVVDKYLAQYKPGVDISTYERRRGHLGVFVEYFDNCNISTIGRAKLNDYWEDLAFLPRQKDIRPDFKDQKVKRVVEKQEKLAQENLRYQGLATQTQAHYREAVSGFYNWCVEKEIVDENVASRKTKRAKRYAEEMENEPREAYTACGAYLGVHEIERPADPLVVVADGVMPVIQRKLLRLDIGHGRCDARGVHLESGRSSRTCNRPDGS